ncbi:MAG: DUF3347 domain-containing protein [bacterium]|nr:DUF3347 domain-containing protein [bacterium]
MKKFIMCLALVMFVVSGTVLIAGDHGGKAKGFKHYVAVQEALAADNVDNAKKALTVLAAASTGEFKKLVESAANAADINAVRKAFKKISAKVAAKGAPEGFGVAYCPMADNNTGAYWVQVKGDISNPYFGSTMLRCGSFKAYKEKKK